MSADDVRPPGTDDGSDPPTGRVTDPGLEPESTDRRAQRPAAGARPSPPRASVAGPTAGASNGLAVAALVLGVVALVFSFVPFLGAFIAIPLGIVAIVLGVLGRGHAQLTGSGGGLAMGGLITGILGIVIALLWGLLLAGLVVSETDGGLTDIIQDLDPLDLER